MRYVALLRAVNLGANRKVPMPELREVFASAGVEEVQTYIQSGNVVFSTGRSDGLALARELESAMAARFGIEVPVVLRSGEEMARAALGNPFVAAGADLNTLAVGFCQVAPSADRLERLLGDPLAEREPGAETFVVDGREIYSWHPGGYGRTKLTIAFFERRLGVLVTVRNWRTTLTLAEMAAGG